MRDFRNLQVWEKAHGLTFIAEGCERNGDAELARFMTISMGSASELEYQLLLAHDLNYFDQNTYAKLHEKVIEVKRMLAGFIKILKK